MPFLFQYTISMFFTLTDLKYTLIMHTNIPTLFIYTYIYITHKYIYNV